MSALPRRRALDRQPQDLRQESLKRRGNIIHGLNLQVHSRWNSGIVHGVHCVGSPGSARYAWLAVGHTHQKHGVDTSIARDRARVPHGVDDRRESSIAMNLPRSHISRIPGRQSDLAGIARGRESSRTRHRPERGSPSCPGRVGPGTRLPLRGRGVCERGRALPLRGSQSAGARDAPAGPRRISTQHE